MKYKFDHDLHIHTYLSSCSADPEETTECILEYAKANKLNTVAVTDHYWDSTVPKPSPWYKPQNFEHIARSLPLPKSEGINFIFGCETDMNKECTIGIPRERYDDFGFILVPTTHLHMKGFTITDADYDSDEVKRAELWIKRFDALLSSDLPFYKTGVAHLTCSLMFRSPEGKCRYLKTLDNIPERELQRLFAAAKDKRLGIELNMFDMMFSESYADTILRIYRVAKYQGCKFYLGSDAHFPKDFKKASEIFDRAINLLDLKESDKIDIASL